MDWYPQTNIEKEVFMIIYGYTRVCSESDINGKESETYLFSTQKERNHIMYEDYSDSFDTMKSEGVIGEEDANTNPKQTEDEFIEEIYNSRDENRDSFGLIQAIEYHIQFEPFCKTL